jgi:limonene-1,2-epoxide hydrolase
MGKATQSQIAMLYVKAFSEKDLASLETMFADNVILTDWEGQVIGRDNVLAFNQVLFKELGNIRIDIDKIAQGHNTVILEIKVILDKTTAISVVDVIDFDQDNKIREIRAYKR